MSDLDLEKKPPPPSSLVKELTSMHADLDRQTRSSFRLDESQLDGSLEAGRVEISDEVSDFDALFRHAVSRPTAAFLSRFFGCGQGQQQFCQNKQPTSIVGLVKRSPTSYAIIEDVHKKLPPLSQLLPSPALNWPFELDTFQKQAILCLERGQSVFVAAHTSAGKTVVAEYASALCRRRGSRMIYTSPIKALSNQKFHDFKQRFGNDVGLLTGDIKLATNASLLVMTTEILHNMLCTGAESIRDLEVVIMDEVHYFNDTKRGYIWEQIMIMLPKRVILVLLSATVPNAADFADWLSRVRGQAVHVVATPSRPIPLEHFLFTALDGQQAVARVDDGRHQHVHRIVDQYNCFCPTGYRSAVESASTQQKKGQPTKQASSAAKPSQEGRGKKPGQHQQPPRKTGGKLDTPGNRRAFASSEKFEVKTFLRASVLTCLTGPNASLPSVTFILQLASRGLAVHHAGMLPVLKESIEILFQRGLIRLLFATETFAMGVNMPARCVVFSTLEKFDGSRRRALLPGEYTQMAGRAGRRGLDPSGTVLIVADSIGQSLVSPVTGFPSEITLRSIILGKASPLLSQFKVTYSMILHLHRSNLLSPQEIMRRSYLQVGDLRRELDRRHQLATLRTRLNAACSSSDRAPVATSSSTTKYGLTDTVSSIGSEPLLRVKCPVTTGCTDENASDSCSDTIQEYYQASCRLRSLGTRYASFLTQLTSPTHLNRLLCLGRLLMIARPCSRCQPLATPALLVDCVKQPSKQGQVDLKLKLVTWSVDNIPPPDWPTRGDLGGDDLDDDEEEEILKDGEEAWMSETPYPPHLMTFFSPQSPAESRSRLCLITTYWPSSSQDVSVLRICDQVIKLPSSAGGSTNAADWICHVVSGHQQQDDQTSDLLLLRPRDSDLAGDRRQSDRLLDQLASSLLDQTKDKRLPPSIPSDQQPIGRMKGALDGGGEENSLGLFEAWTSLTDALSSAPSSNHPTCPNLPGHFAALHWSCRRRWAIARLETLLSDDRLVASADYAARLKVLGELGFLDDDASSQGGCLTLKGLIACELQQMEVLLTQLLLDGSLTSLKPADLAALLSCFVVESRSQRLANQNSTQPAPAGSSEAGQVPDNVPSHLGPVVGHALATGSMLESLHRQHGVIGGEDDYQLDTSLVGVTFAWASGHSFASIASSSAANSLSEGAIVRGLTRLDELLRHVQSACLMQLRDRLLASRVGEARALIHRGLICSPTLYVSTDIGSSPVKGDEETTDDQSEQPIDSSNDDSD